jgi:hypothetical protein
MNNATTNSEAAECDKYLCAQDQCFSLRNRKVAYAHITWLLGHLRRRYLLKYLWK